MKTSWKDVKTSVIREKTCALLDLVVLITFHRTRAIVLEQDMRENSAIFSVSFEAL